MTPFRKLCLALLSTCAASCNQSSGPKTLQTPPVPSVLVASPSTDPPKKNVYSVEDLLANPQKFAHTMVTVKGCFVTNFELVALQPCGSELAAGKLIWVENAGMVAMMLRSGPESAPSAPRGGLLFAYDEARDLRTWRKLPKGYSIAGSEVVLLGQFETSTGGFGHLGSYSNELILADVLTDKPATRPKRR